MECKWCGEEYKLIKEEKRIKNYKCKCGAKKIAITETEFKARPLEIAKEEL